MGNAVQYEATVCVVQESIRWKGNQIRDDSQIETKSTKKVNCKKSATKDLHLVSPTPLHFVIGPMGGLYSNI